MRARGGPARARAATFALVALAALVQCAPRAAPGLPAEARAMQRGALPVERTPDGFRLDATAPPRGAWRGGAGVQAELGATAASPTWLSAARASGRVGVSRDVAGDARAELRGAVVTYAGDDADVAIFARPGAVHEQVTVRRARSLVYRLALPAGFTARALDRSVVELDDARGEPALRVTAGRAWDAKERPLPVRLALDADRLRIEIDAPSPAFPVVTTPVWTTAEAPVHIRAGHTATVLGDGTVLVAGGGAAPDTSELFDPALGRFRAGPTMGAKRTHHTATLLLSGQVLLAGGDFETTCDLYDPRTATFTKTSGLSVPRGGGAAVRLRSGAVLIAGGAGATDASAEIFDPKTGTFTKTATRSTPGDGTLTVLGSGSVLFAGRSAAEIFDPAFGTWTVVTAGPTLTDMPRVAVLLRDGTVLVTSTDGCFSTAGPSNCPTRAQIFDPAANGGLGAFGPVTPDFPGLAGGSTASLLPNGQVLVTAGAAPATTSQIYLPGSGNVVVDAPMTTPHADHTATVLPGGDVLVLGGDQASVDLRVFPGAVAPAASSLTVPRQGHSAVRLRNGRVLVVGGSSHLPTTPVVTYASAEIYDPTTDTFAATGTMTAARVTPTTTLLSDGRVLVAGGWDDNTQMLASAEIYDPAAGTFRAVGRMTVPRAAHAAARLADGSVLVTGGCRYPGDPTCEHDASVRTAEIFDPTTESFRALAGSPGLHKDHGLVRLPTGNVLVVGDATAEIFDPRAQTFRPTAAPGATRDGRTARLLAGGRVFVAGGDTLAGELYDPVTETWSFTTAAPLSLPDTQWTPLADGRLLSSGGALAQQPTTQMMLFDPRSAGNGAAAIAQDTGNGTGRRRHSATNLGGGAVLVAGGDSSAGGVLGVVYADAFVWSPGASAASKPVLASAPAQALGGATVTLTGSGFANGPEGTAGTASSSAGNAPLAFWVSEADDAVVPGTVTDFTDTSATWIAPHTALYGRGRVQVIVGGVLSAPAPLEILPANAATGCAFDAECATGFCTDGVCCDRRCDARCEGCSAARKKQGADGVCGPVPPGADIKGLCFALEGQPCTAASECATGFCTGNVCCDSACAGSCLSCTLASHVGQCTAINEGACDVACDGAHTLKKVGTPDVDCTPFTCDGKTCRTSCASARDCAAPFVCGLDGVCTAPVNAPPSDVSTWGCAMAPRTAAGDALGALGAIAALGGAYARRRARRRGAS